MTDYAAQQQQHVVSKSDDVGPPAERVVLDASGKETSVLSAETTSGSGNNGTGESLEEGTRRQGQHTHGVPELVVGGGNGGRSGGNGSAADSLGTAPKRKWFAYVRTKDFWIVMLLG